MSTAARIDELRKKFEENPRRYFAPLANEYRKAGDLPQAIALCREHLPKQPGHMSGYIVFGQALFEAGELAEARGVFEQALDLDPENLIALRHLGDIAKNSGDTVTARRWWERVLDADPRNDDIAAQLATLGTGRTPISSPAITPPAAPSSVTPFTRPMETPPIGIPSFGLAAMPTPDSVMRAVDLDAIAPHLPSRTPIDLDAIESAGAQTVPSPKDEADAFEFPDDATIPEAAAPPMADARSSADLLDLASADDEVAHPVDAAVTDVAIAEERSAPLHAADDASVTAVDEAFEEGLVAPTWPDTSDLVARVLTPRAPTPISLTPQSRTPISSAVLADTVAAFGAEPQDAPIMESSVAHVPAEATFVAQPQPTESSDDAEPVFEEVIELDVLDLDAAASVEPEVASIDSAVDAVEYDASPVESDLAEPVSEQRQDDFEAPVAAAYAASEEMLAAAAEETPGNAVLEASDAPVDDAWNADASVDDVTDVEAWHSPTDTVEAEHVEAAATPAPEFVASTTPSDVALPWLAVPDAELVSPAEEASEQPGLEELAEAFAGDARAAGLDASVTVASLEEPVASDDVQSFADLAANSDEAALDEGYPEELVDVAPEAASVSSESPAFVTETMGELLVSQGFLARAVTVYEELVRRRPFDVVLDARLNELREMVAASMTVSHPTPAAATPAIATPAMATPAIGAAVTHDELAHAAPDVTEAEAIAASFEDATFVPTMPTPAYGTPAFGTPFSSASLTPPMAAVATPLVTPPVAHYPTPYAQPSQDSVLGRRTAREWFSALAARRVPRRTPAQSSVAIEAPADGLSSLFGTDPEGHDDSAARSLAEAFAPVSADDVATGHTLDFDFARATPAFGSVASEMDSPTGGLSRITPVVPPRAMSATPAGTFAPISAPSSGSPLGGGSNAGFAFDKFFPDPATRRGTPAAAAPSTPEAPVTDDLAQFSAWLKGLGNT